MTKTLQKASSGTVLDRHVHNISTSRNPSLSGIRRITFACWAAGVAILLWSPTVALAQIEVDVLTSAPKTAETPNSGTATDDGEIGPNGLKQDKSADQAAQRIVPAPGTSMQSTEGGTLGGEHAVAEEPSLKLSNGQAVLKEGETTESVAVRSGAELLRMLGLQRQAKKNGEELDMEETTTNSLFDMSAVRRLKGGEPTVVYQNIVGDTPLPDPMIVPWIRQAKLLQERFDKAISLLGDNHVDQGRQELFGIIADFPDSDHALQAKAILAKLDNINKSDMPKPVMKKEETTITVELSPNISVGAVIVDPGSPSGNRVMIAGKAYKVGDEIYRAPGHRVVGISENDVRIEVEQSGMKKTFDVPVRPKGTNE